MPAWAHMLLGWGSPNTHLSLDVPLGSHLNARPSCSPTHQHYQPIPHQLPPSSHQVSEGDQACSEDGHTWRLMKGKDGTLRTARELRVVLETLQESFDPIISEVCSMCVD